jgi:hypothetical protein
MRLTFKKARPRLLFAGLIAFSAGIWPTLYCPLGEDKAGNPMRENRITGAEEIKPVGSSEWMDAAEYRQLTRQEPDESLMPVVVQR